MTERSELKVFGQAFFKKLAGCRAEPYDLALIGAQRMRKSQGNSLATFGCLRLSRTVAHREDGFPEAGLRANVRTHP